MIRRVSWLRKYGKGNELLDVGFGSGDFMVAAHRAGWNVRGVDYNSEMVDSVSRELGYDVRQGELEAGLWPAGQLDVVSIWNVLEHVPDPLHDLKLAAQYLRTGGAVLIQVPSHRGAENGQWFGQYWRMLDIPRHLNFFNRSSISTLCAQAGLKLVFYKTPFVQSAWCYYAACWYWSKGNGIPNFTKFRFIALSAFVTLLLPYIAVQALRARGAELVAIAVKC
jgi:2-polyprenyl-3-methyl-5-hydroxy-6-metoxy-1,4-benzoquinol methylase